MDNSVLFDYVIYYLKVHVNVYFVHFYRTKYIDFKLPFRYFLLIATYTFTSFPYKETLLPRERIYIFFNEKKKSVFPCIPHGLHLTFLSCLKNKDKTCFVPRFYQSQTKDFLFPKQDKGNNKMTQVCDKNIEERLKEANNKCVIWK